MVRNADKVLTHRVLLAVWGGDYVEQTEYLRSIGQLRRKLSRTRQDRVISLQSRGLGTG
jgi:DNA-binding winged helix-turn-helix (wHTH) protein